MARSKISGKIEHGTGLGSKISYPTINIVVDRDDSVRGVYVCCVRLSEREFHGAGYVGEKSTLPEGKDICEVYLFEDCGDIYGEMVEVELIKKIRDVQKVENLEELKLLISNDVTKAKEWLSKN
jgi:riboflavin kinase / FMN adenylyltransferase